MSATSIPNLNTLRRGRGGIRGGGSSRTSQTDKDATIRSTDNDAASSRISAVEARYLDDPFAHYLVGESWQRRLPLMNRGTYVRTIAIDNVVETFLSSTSGSRQIISLGAGSDTRYFRLRREKKHSNFTYHELDFADNNRTKINRLKSASKSIQDLCSVDLDQAQISDNMLQSSEYCIHSIDLRRLPPKLEWVDTTRATLLISECCLIYLSPEEAENVLSYFSGLLRSVPLAIVIYEPFRPSDSFGKTMIRNLMTRGIILQTIEKYGDLDQQRERLATLEFEAQAVDTNTIWQNWVNQEEKDRIDKLEWLDEVEEFILLAKHYCVAWGWRHFQDDAPWHSLSFT